MISDQWINWCTLLKRSVQIFSTYCDFQNGTQELLPLKELYCVMGCNDAVNRYFHELQGTVVYYLYIYNYEAPNSVTMCHWD